MGTGAFLPHPTEHCPGFQRWGASPGEGPVREQQLTVADANGRGVAGPSHLGAEEADAALRHLGDPPIGVGLLGAPPGPLSDADQQQVLHEILNEPSATWVIEMPGSNKDARRCMRVSLRGPAGRQPWLGSGGAQAMAEAA